MKWNEKKPTTSQWPAIQIQSIKSNETIRCGPSPSGSSSAHFMSPSPKNIISSPLSSPSHPQPADSPLTINSTSTFQIRKPNLVSSTANDSTNPTQLNQPVAQTTTLNLHGINFSSLQGAISTFPHLQNVQVTPQINENEIHEKTVAIMPPRDLIWWNFITISFLRRKNNRYKYQAWLNPYHCHWLERPEPREIR